MKKSLLLLFVLLLSGCSSIQGIIDKEVMKTPTLRSDETPSPTATPDMPYMLGEQLLSEEFNTENAWESYQDDDSMLTVKDGQYQIKVSTKGYVWGLNEIEHSDVVIDVTAEQLDGPDNNAYGVICRADTANDGDGYYFLVSGDGGYHIGKGTGDDIVALAEWDSSVLINKGSAVNTIRATCIGDQLSLYVNGQLMVEAKDSEFSTGYTGLTAAVFEDDGTTDVAFDHLVIWSASEKEE